MQLRQRERIAAGVRSEMERANMAIVALAGLAQHEPDCSSSR